MFAFLIMLIRVIGKGVPTQGFFYIFIMYSEISFN